MSTDIFCSTCGEGYVGDDHEDAGFHRCVESWLWNPTWHCDACLAQCPACLEESARDG